MQIVNQISNVDMLITMRSGTVLESYKYDTYGNCDILEPNFADDPDGKTDYDNPYLFTGRRVDYLDNGSLKLQYNRNRYYDQYTGRWLTQDPLGITPNPQSQIRFEPSEQYGDGLCLYTYVSDRPVIGFDPDGKWTISIWDCSILRESLCLWRLRLGGLPGMHVFDYAHCWPKTPPRDRRGDLSRGEDEIRKCEQCVAVDAIQHNARLMAPILVVDLVEVIGAGCAFLVGGPVGKGIAGGIGIEIAAGTGCGFIIKSKISEAASKAKRACREGVRGIQDDLVFSSTQADEDPDR